MPNDSSQRCIGQQIVSSPNDCPSSITCPKKEQVVCPTGECVDNEIECPRLTECSGDYPYLCQNDVCAKSYETCPVSVSCGENKYYVLIINVKKAVDYYLVSYNL